MSPAGFSRRRRWLSTRRQPDPSESVFQNGTTITATVPAGLPAGAAAIKVQSGGASTNSVVLPVAITAPGIFSQSGTG